MRKSAWGRGKSRVNKSGQEGRKTGIFADSLYGRSLVYSAARLWEALPNKVGGWSQWSLLWQEGIIKQPRLPLLLSPTTCTRSSDGCLRLSRLRRSCWSGFYFQRNDHGHSRGHICRPSDRCGSRTLSLSDWLLPSLQIRRFGCHVCCCTQSNPSKT